MAATVEKTYAQTATLLKKGEVSSFYLIWGDEPYLMEKIVAGIKRLCISSGFEDLDFVKSDWDSKKMNPERLYELAFTPPFFSKKRVVVLCNTGIAFGKISEGDMDEYGKVLAGLPDSTCLIFLEEKVDKRKRKLLERLATYGSLVHIEKQKEEDLCKWAGVLLQRESIRITIDGVNSLVDRASGDMRTLENEVQKLILYCKYQQLSEISKEEIDRICIPDLRGSVFQMTDAIGVRDVQTALSILERLVVMKEPVTRIRFMLTRHIRQLLCAKETKTASALATALKISPYIGQKLIRQAQRFQMDELMRFYLLCAQSDYQIKTGQIEERLALDLLICTANEKVNTKPKLRWNNV